jgi:flagellar biosynthesis/type III secretory pathway protein FliH
MIQKIADSLSVKYDNARKELDEIMGGKILEFRGESIFNKGKEEGREEGMAEGIERGEIKGLLDLAYDNTLPVDVAAKRAETKYKVSKEDFMKMLKAYKPDDDLMQG